MHFLDRERIFFDQAAILVQVGLLDATRLPVVRRDAADCLAGAAVAPNRLIERARKA